MVERLALSRPEKKWGTRFGKGDSHTPCYSRARVGVYRGLLLGVCGWDSHTTRTIVTNAQAVPKLGRPADLPRCPPQVVVCDDSYRV